MDVESIVRAIGEKQREEVVARKKENLTDEEFGRILNTGEWDQKGRIKVGGKRVAIWKRRWIERFAADLGFTRKEYRPAIDEVIKGTFPQYLRYIVSGKETYFFHPDVKDWLPDSVRSVAKKGKYERTRERDPLEELFVAQIDKALEVASYDDAETVATIRDYIANQHHEGTIWLPASLHPALLPPLRDPRFGEWAIPPYWREWYSWLLDVRTQMIRQHGRIPPELRGASPKEMKNINELTLLIGYSTIEGPGCPKLRGRESPDIFEMVKELLEKARIDLQDMTPPEISWSTEHYYRDQSIAECWLRSLYIYLDDHRELWIRLARKMVDLQEEEMRAPPSDYVTVSEKYMPEPDRYEPDTDKLFGRYRSDKEEKED